MVIPLRNHHSKDIKSRSEDSYKPLLEVGVQLVAVHDSRRFVLAQDPLDRSESLQPDAAVAAAAEHFPKFLCQFETFFLVGPLLLGFVEASRLRIRGSLSPRPYIVSAFKKPRIAVGWSAGEILATDFLDDYGGKGLRSVSCRFPHVEFKQCLSYYRFSFHVNAIFCFGWGIGPE